MSLLLGGVAYASRGAKERSDRLYGRTSAHAKRLVPYGVGVKLASLRLRPQEVHA